MFTFQYFHIPKTLSRDYCQRALQALEKVVPSTNSGGTKKPQQGIVNLIVIDTEEMAAMNEKFRGKIGPTDILTFSYLPKVQSSSAAADKVQSGGIVSVIPESGNANEVAGEMSGIQVNKLSHSESYKNKGNDNGLDSRSIGTSAFVTRSEFVTPSLRGNDGEVVGEIYLCLEKIKLYAKESGKTYKEKLEYIVIHGLAHLMGYDHETDKQSDEMERIEKKLQSEIQQ